MVKETVKPVLAVQTDDDDIKCQDAWISTCPNFKKKMSVNGTQATCTYGTCNVRIYPPDHTWCYYVQVGHFNVETYGFSFK